MAARFDRHEFRWNQWNREKIAIHNVSEWEAEHVVRNPERGYPRRHKKGTWIVVGRISTGETLQVVFLIDELDFIFVIHAMRR